MDGNSLGATWDSNAGVVFATANPSTGLQRVSAEGGAAEVLTMPDRTRGEADHVWPEILPDGRGVLFTITAARGGLENAVIAVRDLSRGTSKILMKGGHHAHYVPGGYLVYGTGNTLRAVAFDLDRTEVLGTSVQVIPRLVTTGEGAADFAVSADGTLVYVDATEGAAALTPVWVDRQGRETPTGVPPGPYQYPRLTQGGDGISLSVSGDRRSVWDLRSGALRPQAGGQLNALWSPDGTRMVFSARADDGNTSLYVQAADGSGGAERLTEGANVQVATSMSPDGRRVVFHEITAAGHRDLRLLTLPGPGVAKGSSALIATQFDERNGIVSPDGRWLVYESDQSSQLEVYVRSFAAPDAREWRVSTEGGRQAVWTRNGDELIYLALDGSFMTVTVAARGSSWRAGAPKRLIDNRYFSGGGVPRQYDVAPDGLKVLVLKQGAGQVRPPQILVVLNWVEELKRLVRAK
jgi:serine/threonine-protein kinase